MMKINLNKPIALLIAIAFITISGFSFAEGVQTSAQQTKSQPIKYEGQSTKFAMMVGDVTHFKAALLTAEQLQEAHQKFTIEIVMVGELVKAISKDKTLLVDINNAEKLGVKLNACAVAMAAFKVSKDKLDPRIVTVRNGWIHMFELKDKGFNTVNS